MKNWHIKNWRFSDQIAMGCMLQIPFFLLTTLTQISFFLNLGGMLYWALFVVHPVYPLTYAPTARALMGMRILGGIGMFVALMTKFQL